jgi:hypothetical protein
LLVFQAHLGARLIFGTLVDGPAVLHLLQRSQSRKIANKARISMQRISKVNAI